MKGMVKAKANKFGPSLCIEIDGEIKWISCNEDQYKRYNKGDAVIFELDDKGKAFKTLKLDSTSAVESEAVPQSNRNELIVRQVCLKCAVELVCAGKVEFMNMYEIAENMNRWINSSSNEVKHG